MVGVKKITGDDDDIGLLLCDGIQQALLRVTEAGVVQVGNLHNGEILKSRGQLVIAHSDVGCLLYTSFSFYVITPYRIKNKSAAEHCNIFFYCFSCDIFPFAALYISFAGQYISDITWRSDASDIGAEEQHDFLQHNLVC